MAAFVGRHRSVVALRHDRATNQGVSRASSMGIFTFFRRVRRSAIEHPVIGVWTLAKAAANIDPGDGCDMYIRSDGTMDYVIHEDGKLQIMKFMYRIEGDQLITNQPSKPREERTTFRFDGDELVLVYDGEESRFRRRPGGSSDFACAREE